MTPARYVETARLEAARRWLEEGSRSVERIAADATLLGIPENYTQAALLPIAWLKGGDLEPAGRLPVSQVSYWEHWGVS